MKEHPIALGNEDSSLMRHAFLESEAALEDFFERWTMGRLPKAAWTHAAHVAMAAYLAFEHPPEETFERMKRGILHHNTAVGTPNTESSGYHETLTRFWSATIGDFVRCGRFASRLEAVRGAVELFGNDRNRHRLSYSFDVVSDQRARREWIRPDREPATRPNN